MLSQSQVLRLLAGIVAAIVFIVAALQMNIHSVSGDTINEAFYQGMGLFSYGMAAFSIALAIPTGGDGPADRRHFGRCVACRELVRRGASSCPHCETQNPLASAAMPKPVRNLLDTEQSLEGALGRAENGVKEAGASVEGKKALALPGGAAYHITTSTPGVSEYVFYRQGTAALITFINFPEGLDGKVAATFAFN